MMNRRIVLIGLAALALSGCGRKGPLEPPPDPSAPNFICDWLGHAKLTLRSGQFPIALLSAARPGIHKQTKERIAAMMVAPESADQLARLIFDPNRGLPVFVIKISSADKTMIVPALLASPETTKDT